MVRETRHLYVGNLPDKISKERIKEYFNRYGPVQSVRSLGPIKDGKDGDVGTMGAVTVAFMDIKSACKALQTTHKLDERLLKTDFYDPTSGGCGGSGPCPPTPEEKGGGPGGGGHQPPNQPAKLEHSRNSSQHSANPGGSHYYRHGDREYGGRGTPGGGHNQHPPPPRYNEDFRHRSSRPPFRNGPFNQDGGRGNTSSGYRNTYGWKDSRSRPEPVNYNSGDKCDGQARLVTKPVNGPGPTAPGGLSLPGLSAGVAGGHKKKHRARKSRSSESGGSDSQQSGSNSRSSSSSSSRSSSSGSGSSKSPSPSRGSRQNSGRGSQMGNYLPHTEFDKLCTVVVRNLPDRPTETVLKEELSREYKKGGCVVRSVRIRQGQAGSPRTAVITFSDPADVSKALEDSRNKRIFGSLIDVEKLTTHTTEDRPRVGDLSEFHPKATRTLFVGNISREVIPSEIHERFKEFGEILEIDIKKPDYALVQFVDIRSVVKAIRAADGELIAGQKIRLDFGLSVATKCVWCDGVGVDVTEKMLQLEFSQYGKIQDLIIDRSRGHALVYFDQLKKATIAVSEMRGRSVLGSRLQTDYASHECRAAFFDHCKKSGMDIRERAKPWEQEPEASDKRTDRSERLQREKSNESRDSGTSRVGRKRDEYDEELRRFQNERGKFENETERCFTPPYSGTRKAGGPSRSPSPPRVVCGPSPNQLSGTRGVDKLSFSDRESVVSDGSRHGSPVPRDNWRGSRYKPRTQAISPPGDSRSPAEPDSDRRGNKRYRPVGNGEAGDTFRTSRGTRAGGVTINQVAPQDPRVEVEQVEKKGQFKVLGVDSGLSEDTSSGSSGSVPDHVDNAKLPSSRSVAARRSSTDSAVSRDTESSRPPTPGHIPVYTSSSLLHVAGEGGELPPFPRSPVSPPPGSGSDGSRPGTPLCDENPENLMSRTAAAPVRLASHLRTSQNSSGPMSLPLPRFAQHVLSTSPGERPPRPLQISPRGPAEPSLLSPQQKPGRPELTKLTIMSPTKLATACSDVRVRDPRLKSPNLKSPSLQPPLKSPSVPGGPKATFLSPEAGSGPPSLTVKVSNLPVDSKPKDPRLGSQGLLTVAVPSVAQSPSSPSPRQSRPRTPPPPIDEAPKVQPLQPQPQQGLLIDSIKDPKPADPSSMELDERLKLLDEKYEAWSGLTRLSGTGNNRQDQTSRFNLDMKPAQPSAIVQKLLSRKSVFDEDSKRLENFNEKYVAPEDERAEGGLCPGGQNLTYNSTIPAPGFQSDSPTFCTDSPVMGTESSYPSNLPREIPTLPLNSVSPIRSLPGKLPPQLPLRQTPANLSPNPSRLYFSPQVIQSPKILDEASSRPLPLPNKAGTPATSGTIPIKPLVDKLSKPAAFTKPSATVTPTLKSTGLTASTVRPTVFTTTSTKTVSTCTMAPTALPPQTNVEKGEASSTTCSPKPDSAMSEVTSSLTPQFQETDSDPNVTSTTGSTESKKKLEISRDLKIIKKEFDNLTSFKEKKDMGEELLFTPTATLIQTVKPKFDKKDKRSNSSSHLDIINTLKDVKKAKESSLHRDKIRSNREKKDKIKVKQKNDLKDFLSATATIRKEAKKEEKREEKKIEKKEDKKEEKREYKKEERREEKKESRKDERKEDKLDDKRVERKESKKEERREEKRETKDERKEDKLETKVERKEEKREDKKEHRREDKKEEKKEDTREERRDENKEDIREDQMCFRKDMSKEDKLNLKKDENRDKERKDYEKNEESKVEHNENKRRLSSTSEMEDIEPKSKMAKTESKVESDCEPEVKKIKAEPMKPMGRIPKLDKKEQVESSTKNDISRDKQRTQSKSESRSKSKYDDKHRHRSSSNKPEERIKEKHKKKKKDKERSKDEKVKKHEPTVAKIHSTDEERYLKKLKKSKEKRREEKRSSKSDRKDKNRDRDKDKSKERERRKKKEEEEQRKMIESARKRKRMEDTSNSEKSDKNSSDDDIQDFSIFDEPVFDPNNPIYFSMYDKVKARRSCVKAKEEEEARRQEEALNKFAKLKAQRAKREGKKKSLDTDNESEDDDEEDILMASRHFNGGHSSDENNEEFIKEAFKKKASSLLCSSSESDIGFPTKTKKKKKSRSDTSSNEERNRPFKIKRTVVDSSDDSSGGNFQKTKQNHSKGLDSSDSENERIPSIKSEHDEDIIMSQSKSKVPIYSDSESEHDTSERLKTKSLRSESETSEAETKLVIGSGIASSFKKGPVSDSDSEPNEPKSSALAVLAKNKKKILKSKPDSRGQVKSEPISSDSDEGSKSSSRPRQVESIKEVKKEIKEEKDVKKELNQEPSIELQKTKPIIKKEKRMKEGKESFKEKSLLGQKLKMATIFGTSSEDECASRNSKPPTPKTGVSKTSSISKVPIKCPKLNVDQVYSDSESENLAVLTDSDDDVPSRPPTPSFPVSKSDESKVGQHKSIVSEIKVKTENNEVEAKPNFAPEEIVTKKEKEEPVTNCSENEILPGDSKQKTILEKERSRRGSSNDKQKENEHLFDSLLTVNVDLPTKIGSRKSPGGSLKSPGPMKSPSLKSPLKTSPISPIGSHRSPLISPGGKPTYLLAHMANQAASREAEKLHRAQEREMQKRVSEKLPKEAFKTKKDLEDGQFPRKYEERHEKSRKTSLTDDGQIPRKYEEKLEKSRKTSLTESSNRSVVKREEIKDQEESTPKTVMYQKEKPITEDKPKDTIKEMSKIITEPSKDEVPNQSHAMIMATPLKDAVKVEKDFHQDVNIADIRNKTNVDTKVIPRQSFVCKSDTFICKQKSKEEVFKNDNKVNEDLSLKTEPTKSDNENKIKNEGKEDVKKKPEISFQENKPLSVPETKTKSVPEHRKISISTYQEARKSRELELSRKAKESELELSRKAKESELELLESSRKAMESELELSRQAKESELELSRQAKESELELSRQVKESELELSRQAKESELESSRKAKEYELSRKAKEYELELSRKAEESELKLAEFNLKNTAKSEMLSLDEKTSMIIETSKKTVMLVTDDSIPKVEKEGNVEKETTYNQSLDETYPNQENEVEIVKSVKVNETTKIIENIDLTEDETCEDQQKTIVKTSEDDSMSKEQQQILVGNADSESKEKLPLVSHEETLNDDKEVLEVPDKSPKSISDNSDTEPDTEDDNADTEPDISCILEPVKVLTSSLKPKASVFDFCDDVEECKLTPKSALDSSKTPLDVKDTSDPVESLCKVSPRTIMDSPIVMTESTKDLSEEEKNSPCYEMFASITQIEATSSPSPMSDYEESPLVILADDEETTDKSQSISSNSSIDLSPNTSIVKSPNSSIDKNTSFDKSLNTSIEKSPNTSIDKSLNTSIDNYKASAENVFLSPQQKILEIAPSPEPHSPIDKTSAHDENTLDDGNESPMHEVGSPDPKPSNEEELKKSIASITYIRPDDSGEETDPDVNIVPHTVPEPEPQVKRTVISQEETESAVNALLGESFESFEEPTDLAAQQPVDRMEDDRIRHLADDEAALAVAGLGIEMSPGNTNDWHNNMDMEKHKESVEAAVASIPGMEKESVEAAVASIPGMEKQEVESIENIAAEIRRSSVEADEQRRISIESKEQEVESDEPVIEEVRVVNTRGRGRPQISPKVTVSPPSQRGRVGRVSRSNPMLESSAKEGVYEIEKREDPPTPRGRGRGGRGSRGMRGGRRILSQTQTDLEERKSGDVFDFQGSDEESIKAVDKLKLSATSVETMVKEVVKINRDDTKPITASPPVEPSRPMVVRGMARTNPPGELIQPITISTSSLVQNNADNIVLQTASPVLSHRVSVDEKLSPTVSLASPSASKSPKPRVRRSTGGKSRESEEENADTLQKINLILEKAKREAEGTARLVTMPGYRVADGGIPITALVSQPGSSTGSADVLIDPKTGQAVRMSAAASVTLTLVSSGESVINSEPRSVAVSHSSPRAGIPQPTVLPPRHDPQVRPPVRQIATCIRPQAAVTTVPRPNNMPIQLPTQPLPPESVRKAQPVLLEQNQPAKLTTVNTIPRTAISVSLPTEPVPRSLANQMPNLPRTPLPFSSAHLVTARTVAVSVTTQATSGISRPVSSVTRPAPCPTIVRPQHNVTETVQRVSLNKRDAMAKEMEADPKPRSQEHNEPIQAQPTALPIATKVRGDYLQPREREVHRPASTPLIINGPPSAPKEEDKHVQYGVPQSHMANSSASQQLETAQIEQIRLQNYREMTLIFQQLVAAGHPEHVANSLAQSMVRDRFLQESVYLQQAAVRSQEEPRPGSVPPSMVHQIEEIRRQQAVVRQPLPAHHNSDPYRQSESPLYLAHNTHPAYSAPPNTHIDNYRRPQGETDLVPPPAHGQQLTRLTQSPAISDYTSSRPASPQSYTPSSISSDYRLPHLAAYPICWSGVLGLKNDMASVRMHYVSGNRDLAKASLPAAGTTLKIVQRMRLEDSQLDGVARKMETKSEHCMLLALPNGAEHEEIEHQSRILRSNFITYLQLKSAAGIVNVSNEDNQPAYIVHVFPSCDFANENLARIAPNLLHRVADIEHLVIVIATVFDVNR